MSALMMALVAGMAVGSDGTERILTDAEQQLGLDGVNWEGTVKSDQLGHFDRVFYGKEVYKAFPALLLTRSISVMRLDSFFPIPLLLR